MNNTMEIHAKNGKLTLFDEEILPPQENTDYCFDTKDVETHEGYIDEPSWKRKGHYKIIKATVTVIKYVKLD